jgi:MoaA/NifB/PqqE/SkfB family radical SAM enzyme
MNKYQDQKNRLQGEEEITLKYDYLLHASVPETEFWGITYPDSEDSIDDLEKLRETCLHYKQLSFEDVKHIDTYKRYNYALALLEYKSYSEYCYSRPFTIQASRSDECNLSCKFCRPEPVQKINSLSIELWQNALSTLLPSAIEFIPYCWGEPLLDKFFATTCALAEKYHAKVSIITNWQQVTGEIAETVLNGVKRMLISVDTSNPETYARIRSGGSLQKVERNLQLLFSTSQRLEKELPWIGLSVVLTKNTLHDLPYLIEWAHENGIRGVSARRIVLRENIANILSEETIDLSSDEYREVHDSSLKCAKKNGMMLNMPVQLYIDRDDTRCVCPWTHLYMNPEGKLHLCAFSHRSTLDTIPIHSDFWNSDNFRRARREFLKTPRCSECASLDSVGIENASQIRGY